jgi:hypothetical protein
MKHYVRREGWLSFARERYRKLRSGRKAKDQRPLRYFTFCAESAIDVLLFELENIVMFDPESGFDSIFFFDRTPESVLETRKRIPRANGFPGDFVRIVLVNDPEENDVAGALDLTDTPEEQENIASVREVENRVLTHKQFVSSFPFDMINLDLEEFLFKPRDPVPGKVINAFRRVFSWQRRPLLRGKKEEFVNEWTLMFTTQIGPENMSDVYLEMLTRRLETNIIADETLRPRLVARTGKDSIVVLKGEDFDTFFKLAMPKLLLGTLMEADWYVDPSRGIKLFQFDREHNEGTYSILHLVMDVIRKHPTVEHRAPMEDSAQAVEAYHRVVHHLFDTPEVMVRPDEIDRAALQADLDRIARRGREFYSD